MDYTTETAADISGGRKTGIDYAHQVAVRTDIDWNQLAGLSGFSTHSVLVNRAGRSASNDFADDDILHAQEIYGSGGDVLVRLAYLYGEQSFADGHLQLSAGRLPVSPVISEFGGSPLFCNFLNLAVCGNPRLFTINKSWPNWPNATWGSRLRTKPSDTFYVDVGLYEVNPRYGGRSGFDWSTRGATGIMTPIEIGYTPSFGSDHLPGHYIAGFGWDNSSYSGLSNDGHSHRGLGLGYVFADQMLLRTGKGPLEGVIALAGYLHADGTISPIQDQAFAGILAQGILPFKAQGTVGLFASYVKLSRAQERAELATLADQAALPAGVDGIQSHETVIELNYQFTALRGLLLIPDVQYVLRPGGTNATPDALFLGLKTHVEF